MWLTWSDPGAEKKTQQVKSDRNVREPGEVQGAEQGGRKVKNGQCMHVPRLESLLKSLSISCSTGLMLLCLAYVLPM